MRAFANMIPNKVRATACLLFLGCLQLPAQSANPAEKGGHLFSVNCAPCHGLDAKGGEHAPNIATNEQVQQMSDAELTRIVHTGIPGAGMPGFAKTLDSDQTQSVIAYLRTLQRSDDPESRSGDKDAGRQLFFGKARCSECHSADGQGGFIAADLSTYGRSHSSGQIRLLMTDRSEIPAEKLAVVTAVTKAGQTVTGLIRNQDNFSLQLQTLEGKYVFLQRSDIKGLAVDDRAMMHSKYFANLSDADVRNLIAFLLKAPASREKSSDEDEQ
jgi:cytochrome c oxidase cbb3-type subunit III